MMRRRAVWLVVLGIAMLLSGCGAGGAPPTSTSPPDATIAPPPPPPPPTASPTPSDEPTGGGGDPLEAELQQLQAGQIVFQVPRDMQLEQPSIVTARISRQGASPITSGLDEEVGGPIEEESLEVSSRMKMVLSADAASFAIDALSDELQLVEETGFTTWRWSVRPLRSGRLVLFLRATAIVTAEGDSASKDIGVFDREIAVSVSFGSRLANFLSDNWQWGAGTLLTIFGLGVGRGWFKRKRAADAAK